MIRAISTCSVALVTLASVVLAAQAGRRTAGHQTLTPQFHTSDRCIACHNGTAAESPRLLDYADLAAPSRTDPTKTMAQAALARMRSKTSPMPPPPAAAPETGEIEAFETWVILGTRKEAEACTDPPPPVKPGGPSAPPVDPNCASGKTWTGGNGGSPLMHPGVACNACHQVMGGPNLAIAGTVFPKAHESDDCNGSAPPPALSVVITDAKARELTLPVNAAGMTIASRVPPARSAAAERD
jgi:hypothetical protein